MKKLLLLSITALTLASTGASAIDNTQKTVSTESKQPATYEHMEKDWTLEEARKKAHEKADKLDKMTEEEYAKYQKNRHEYREKLRSMTPEQREEFFKKKHEEKSKQ